MRLVRAASKDPDLLTPNEEAVLRTAISLARMYRVRHGTRDVGVGASLRPFREDVSRRAGAVLLGKAPLRRELLVPLARELREPTLRTREALLHRFRDRLPEEVIDKELRNKSLVLVAGGGGGTAYVYVGVMSLLEEFGLRPALLAGTSMGAILCLFRSRLPHFDQNEVVNIVRGLSWRKLFRGVSVDSRYGVPAALRLYLRSGIGRYFNTGEDSGGPGIRLSELPVPTIISVSGVRKGMLPHPLSFYERLLNISAVSLLDPLNLARQAQQAMGAVGEFFTRPEMMVSLHLGADRETAEFDALDAAGFSSALPGVIHYDILRDDHRMTELLDATLERRGVSRLVDGGLTDNLPAKAAWRSVHKGFIGTRNAFILGLNGFAPKLSSPLWLPLSRLAAINVDRNRPYAHLVMDFKRTLSPLELVPSIELITRVTQLGRAQLNDEMPFLCRMLAPLPRML